LKDTKERILLASLELFARYGYDAASVSRIAEAVGLTKGALYRHFEDKAAILRAILARMEADDAAFAGRFALPTGEALDSSIERAPSDGTRDSSAKRAPSAGTLDSSMERAPSDGTRDSSTERATSDGTLDSSMERAPSDGTRDSSARRAPSGGTLDSSMERAPSDGTRDSSAKRAPSGGTLDSSMERAAQGKTLAPSVETTKIAARVGRFEPTTDASPSTAAGASGRSADAAALVAFARAMFAYWTEDAFASAFRRMLTVSQYTSPEMRALYRQYLADGPLAYCEDILKAAGHADARLKALRLFAPMTFLYALYDGEADHAETLRLADAHFSSMARELCSGFTIRKEGNSMEYPRSKNYETPELMAKIMGPNPVKLEEELMEGCLIPAGSVVCDLGSGQG